MSSRTSCRPLPAESGAWASTSSGASPTTGASPRFQAARRCGPPSTGGRDEPEAGGPRSRAVKSLHAATVAVLVAGVVVVGGATVITEVLHRDTEQRLLDQRTGEAGAILATSIGGLQTPLSSAAELAQVTDGDPDAFRAVMGHLVGHD